MILRHYFLLLCLLCAAHLTGCRTAHPVDSRPNAELVAPAVKPDSMTLPQNVMTTPQNVMTLPAKPALLPRLTDALGISTPEGRARRQAVKLARAAVPRSIGKGAVYAPLATDVVNAYKPRQAVAVARDSATVQVATNAVAGRGNTATQTATTQAARGFWATFAKPLGYVGAAAAAGAGLYLLYLIWAFIPRRKDNQA